MQGDRQRKFHAGNTECRCVQVSTQPFICRDHSLLPFCKHWFDTHFLPASTWHTNGVQHRWNHYTGIKTRKPCKPIFTDCFVGCAADLCTSDPDEMYCTKDLPERNEKFQHLLPGLTILTSEHLLIVRIKIHLVHQVAREKSSSRPRTIVRIDPDFHVGSILELAGIEGRTPHHGNHHDIPVTANAGRNRILYVEKGIAGIDILIHNNNVFQGSVSGKCSHNRIFCITLGPFFNLDNRVEITATTFGQHDILHFSHSGNRTINFRFIGCTHQHFMFIATRQNTVIDKVGFEVHTGKFNHRLLSHGIIGSGDVDKGAFFCDFPPIYPSKTISAFYGTSTPLLHCPDGNFTPHEFGCKTKFLYRGEHQYPGKCYCRMCSNGHRNGEFLPLCQCFSQHHMRVPALNKPCGHTVFVQYLRPGWIDTLSTPSSREKTIPDVRYFPGILWEMMHDGNYGGDRVFSSWACLPFLLLHQNSHRQVFLPSSSRQYREQGRERDGSR